MGGPGPFNWQQLERTDPELYKLEVEDQRLEREAFTIASQYRNTPADARDELKKQLQDLVTKHFEVRQKKRELHLSRMEKELQRMREELAKRNEAKDRIVGRRLSELTGEKGDLDF